ncbi:hypothetical protein CPter291_3357 [Collimonas pratensis]|uniref:Uncharacterized protein n=1 Tax=Collimonas pratensis TaxID=279113 RepID=A0ABM5Z8Y4_9BURK|nr:hypothetical protein CPter291_3357 [Collimonas pratensis]
MHVSIGLIFLDFCTTGWERHHQISTTLPPPSPYRYYHNAAISAL